MAESMQRQTVRRLWDGGRGMTPQEIARALNKTTQTIYKHIDAIRAADQAKEAKKRAGSTKRG